MNPPSLKEFRAKRRSATDTPQQRILESARGEIEEVGIRGLRVAEVAKNAYTSVTLIYRYFGDRDGLLAQVLGDMYAEFQENTVSDFMKQLEPLQPLTVQNVVDAMPDIDDPGFKKRHAQRLQILATAVNNDQLRARIEQITQEQASDWTNALKQVIGSMKPGEKLNLRIFSMMFAMQTMYYRELMGDRAFTQKDYRQFVYDVLKA
ncbi:MAG: TetR/AcrR family transcriptional regulator [Actinobacteria bacterium]|nr:TetR/AcrR family transcriptional regulator [Actinomycetota bacterium]